MNQLFSYDHKKIITEQELGSGPFGTVHPYRKKADDNRWVAKYILTRNFEELKVVMRGVFQNCNHDYPGILCPKNVYLSESFPKGYRALIKYPRLRHSLKNILDKQRDRLDRGYEDAYFTKEEVIQYLYSILVSLEYLQKKGIAHQNLKPTNILVDETGRLRLSDVGLVKEYLQEFNTGNFQILKRGPEFYQPSELFKDNGPKHKAQLFKADIWSLGMIMVEICLLEPENMFPFGPLEQRKERVDGYIDQISHRYGEEIARIIEGLLKFDADERKTAIELCQVIRAMYPDIREFGNRLEPDKTSKEIENLQPVIKDLGEKFAKNFKIEQNKIFTIQALENAKVTDEELNNLLVELRKNLQEHQMQRLEDLALNLRGCHDLTNEGFKRVADYIGENFESLKNFSFALGPKDLKKDCKINDEGLSHLSDNINKKITGLTHLSLDLNGCSLLTENAIKQLVADLSVNMTKLQQLSLEFGMHPNKRGSSKQISDQNLEVITENIGSKLSSLTELSLTFRGYPEITDSGLEYLEANIICKLQGLSKLSLKFYRLDKITGEGVKQLAVAIRENLRNLKHLTFVISWCEQVTNEDKAQFKKTLLLIDNLTL